MLDSDPRQLVSNALPLIAVVLFASGIFVKTLPLVSKRPTDIERAKISHAGRQDVEARLWQDPFVAMRDIKGNTPDKRCGEAIKDSAHHPLTLTGQIRWRRRGKDSISVLPVMVPGGPYFEDGEARRRNRYATVMALLKTEWEPFREDKLGFVWTFESCEEKPWQRQLPELLPYEWFRQEDQEGKEKWLLVLWVDEDAITRRPLFAMQKLTELIRNGGVPCQRPKGKHEQFWSKELIERLARKDKDKVVCVEEPAETPKDFFERRLNRKSPPWKRMPVIGPWTSAALGGLISDVAFEAVQTHLLQLSKNGQSEELIKPVFYSASATTAIPNKDFCNGIIGAQERWRRNLKRQRQDQRELERKRVCPVCPVVSSNALKKALDAFSATPANGTCPEKLIKETKNAFHARFVRLTSTDDQHTKALIEEIRLRLVKPSLSFAGDEEELCRSTVVLVAEADTSYARDFQKEFNNQLGHKCKGKTINVREVSYLKGLDGAFPHGGGAPQAAAASTTNDKLPRNEKWLEQATLERADGPSQYDYLRRLATHIEDLDRAERNAGRHGISAIGVLGNDTYDKILVLDVLRDRFPSAVFFAADLDARLLAAGANRSTRNLVVASGFGFKLRPGLQGRAPPFRDTYQTGIFLAVQVALDQVALDQVAPDQSGYTIKTKDFLCWFAQPRLFEIGRTRPVNLIPPGMTEGERTCIKNSGYIGYRKKSTEKAVRAVLAGQTADDPECKKNEKNNKCRPLPENYLNGIHDDTDWRPFFPLPSFFSVMFFIGMALVATVLAFLLSKRARDALIEVHDAWVDRTPIKKCALAALVALVLAALGLFFFFIYNAISQDVRSLKGEPFAWLEGVSIWPTQIIRLIILFLTVALLIYGRARLRWDIDGFAKRFQLAPLTGQANAGLLERLNPKWLWWLDAQKPQTDKEALDGWKEYIVHMGLWPSFIRIGIMTMLFFLFCFALLSFDWPYSPHRGTFAASFNYALQLILLLAVMALLFAAIDASLMAARLFNCFRDTEKLAAEPIVPGVAERYPVGAGANRWINRFLLAAKLSTSVNRLIYMPFLSLLLLVPARSQLFDAWNFPLPHAALFVVSLSLAVGCAMRLRLDARELRDQVLRQINLEAEKFELLASRRGDAPNKSGVTPQAYKAERLRSMATEIRENHEGAFRPLLQEPVIRGILFLLGGAGGVATAEFLLLKS